MWSAAILAGGRARRLGGRDKAALRIGSASILDRQLALLRPLIGRILIVADDETPFAGSGVPVVPDLKPGAGALGGLYTAITAAATPRTLVLACDLPFLEGKFLEALVRRALAGRAQAVVPRTADGWQPLCAAYHRNCVPVMEQALDRDSTGIVEVLPALKVDAIASEELARLGFSERVFRNINTPADWETAQRELELTRR